MEAETLRKLDEMKLIGMMEKFKELFASARTREMSYEDIVATLVDSEYDRRRKSRIASLLKAARIKLPSACVEEVEFSAARNLKKDVFRELQSCTFIEKSQNILISGPTGTGKSYMACALANLACRNGHSTLYFRVSRLLEYVAAEKMLGNYLKALEKLGKVKLLILDDLGSGVMTKDQRNIFFEIIEERYLNGPVILTSQLPMDKWYEVFDDPTTADAICDRLLHNAHQINLKGESMRKK